MTPTHPWLARPHAPLHPAQLGSFCHRGASPWLWPSRSGAGHFTLGDSPALIRLIENIGQIEGAFEADRARRVGLLSGAVLTVQNATQIILHPVAQIASDVNQ